MARRKTLPESVRAKQALAERLALLRSELYGERGGPEMARRLGIPVRTWYNYEGGVTVPAEVVLRIIELTSVEPTWLLHGKGAKFRHLRSERRDVSSPPAMTVGALLRTALQLLEDGETVAWPGRARPLHTSETMEDDGAGEDASASTSEPDLPTNWEPAGGQDEEPHLGENLSRKSSLGSQRENRCIEVSGDAMVPIVADGASVTYSHQEEEPNLLDGKLVVVWLENQPVVRWFRHCGRYALLRAENPKTVPQQILVDLGETRELPQIRRVLWINTPH
jgi:hypothetical protein